MRDYSRTHVSDTDLLRHAVQRVRRDRYNTVQLLADLAEIDHRQLYRQTGHSSLFAFCIEELHLSEDETCKRVQAARSGRRFPVLFFEMEQRRLHLTAVCLLAPHLTEENLDELVAASVRKTRVEIERFIALRFSPSRAPTKPATIRAIPTKILGHALEQVKTLPDLLSGAAKPDQSERESEATPIERPSPHFLFRAEIDEETNEDLCAIRDLLGHSIPSGNMSLVLKRMARDYRALLQKKRFGAGRPPRRSGQRVGHRYVPVHVRQAVRQRDGGQCTYVSPAGHRCTTRRLVELDHIVPVARGGQATADNLRLRCHAHNQYEAERVFGAEFMQRKREAASAGAAPGRAPPG